VKPERDVHSAKANGPAGGRRVFLKKLGVGAAVAWSAPALVSAQASAGPGTPCPPGGIDWGSTSLDRGDGGTITTGVLPLSAYPLTTAGVSVGLVDVGGAYAAGGAIPSGIDGTFPRPGENESLHIQMGNSGSGPLTITFTFVPPVTNLSFSVLDIDRGGTNSGYNDRINVTGSIGGSSTAGTGTPVSAPPTVVLTPNEEFESTAHVSNPVGTGDVHFNFPGPVDQVVIVYSRSGTTASQGIGFSNLTFDC
jgi:hypothetical protein